MREEPAIAQGEESMRKELAYYRRLLEESGNRHLREAERLSELIARLRRTEEELERYRDKLEVRVQKRTEELVASNEQLRQEMAQRERVETELRESEHRFRLFMEHFPGLAYIKDAQLRTLFANQGFKTWLGLDPADVPGKTNLDLFPAEFARQITADDLNALEQGSLRTEEYFNGRHWASYKFAIRRPNAPPMLGGLTLDITERKKAEAERLEFERRLLHTQKLESLGVLAGGIAHDFNNLLTTILGNASLLAEDLPRDPQVQQSIRDVSEAARTGADLCRQMLAYAGRGRFVLETFPLNILVEGMLHLLKTSLSRRAGLELRLASSAPPMRGDLAQVRQLLINLVTNASEALGDKGGTIFITTGCSTLTTEQLRSTVLGDGLNPGDFVWLEIQDSGCGMDAETQKRIFEPFFTTKFLGRGLGLAAVMGIVRGHHGTLTLDSLPGQGTTFRVLFPAATPGQARLS